MNIINTLQLLFSLILISSFLFATPSIDSVSIEPANYYTDSEELNLVFDISDLDPDLTYSLSLTQMEAYDIIITKTTIFALG